MSRRTKIPKVRSTSTFVTSRTMKLNGYGQINNVLRGKSIENRLLTEMNHVRITIYRIAVAQLLFHCCFIYIYMLHLLFQKTQMNRLLVNRY